MKLNIFTTLTILSTIKRFLKEPLYLNILAPLIGIYQFCAAKGKIEKAYYPFLAMLAFGLLANLINSTSLGAYARLGQYLGLIYFSSFWVKHLNKNFLLIMTRLVIALGIVIQLSELFFPAPFTSIFGHPRYSGIVGEPNFTAVLALTFFAINIFQKRYKEAALLLMLLIGPFSRGSFVALSIFLSFLFCRKFIFNDKLVRGLTWGILISLFLYPIAIFSSWQLLNNEQKIEIAKHSPRYYLQTSYSYMFLDNPLGVGVKLGEQKIDPYQKRIEFPNNPHDVFAQEQHNLYFQILTEFGIGAYLCFVLFIFKLFTKSSLELRLVLLTPLISFVFLNGLSEIILYLTLSLVIQNFKFESETKSIK